MARPRKHEEPMQSGTLRVVAPDWADLDYIYGDQRAELVRRLIAAHLQRPGAEMPKPPSQAALRRARAARTAAAG